MPWCRVTAGDGPGASAGEAEAEEPGHDGRCRRRYTAQDAIDLIKIRALAEAGVPLARIRALKAAPDEAGDLPGQATGSEIPQLIQGAVNASSPAWRRLDSLIRERTAARIRTRRRLEALRARSRTRTRAVPGDVGIRWHTCRLARTGVVAARPAASPPGLAAAAPLPHPR
jgi:DNA-binding transcriptional MerR regulator